MTTNIYPRNFLKYVQSYQALELEVSFKGKLETHVDNISRGNVSNELTDPVNKQRYIRPEKWVTHM